MKYNIYEINEIQEDLIFSTNNKKTAKEKASAAWKHLSSYDQKYNRIEIRTNESYDGMTYDYDLIKF